MAIQNKAITGVIGDKSDDLLKYLEDNNIDNLKAYIIQNVNGEYRQVGRVKRKILSDNFRY